LGELAKEQEEKSKLVKRYDENPDDCTYITGVDVSYSNDQAIGYAVVANTATQEIIDTAMCAAEIDSEYISGFFQLREGPIILKLLSSLETTGTVLIDGNGVLHPRRFGIASYVGLKMNVQTVGVAKSLMLGEIGQRSGDTADIVHNNEVIGRALWLGKRKPIYISIGHRITLESAVKVVRDSCVNDYPHVLHQAHVKSKEEIDRIHHL
jgi:deoxyribonuclease V